jgi:hypothetical protein
MNEYMSIPNSKLLSAYIVSLTNIALRKP